jgi:hypothetical protein
MGDVHHVADRAPDHALGAGIGAATGAHDARHGLAVGLDRAAFHAGVVGRHVRGAFLAGLFRIEFEGFLDELFGGFFLDARQRGLDRFILLFHVSLLW